jgi:hypothetical protein
MKAKRFLKSTVLGTFALSVAVAACSGDDDATEPNDNGGAGADGGGTKTGGSAGSGAGKAGSAPQAGNGGSAPQAGSGGADDTAGTGGDPVAGASLGGDAAGGTGTIGGEGGSGGEGTTPLVCPSLVSPGQAMYFEDIGTVNVTKAGAPVTTFNLNFAFGSSVFHGASDEANVFWAVTDRGPNVDCDSATLSVNKDYCLAANKLFLRPSFTPTIVKVRLTRAAAPGCQLEVAVEDAVEIVNSSGLNVSGLPITPAYNTEEAVAPDGSILPDNDDGMDTEGLVRLADGSFWLSEEYGPSLVHVDVDGVVLERVTPAGVNVGSGYTPKAMVTDGLPAILGKRKQNRGFESLALSPEGNFLYVATQSPLLQPDKATGEASLNIRLFKLELNANHTFKQVTGEWLYVMEAASTFVPAGGTLPKTKDLKISEMVALGADDLLVQERTDDYFKIFRVKLADADKLAAKWDVLATDPSLEKLLQADLAGASVTALAKTPVFDMVTYAGSPALPKKVEGVGVLGDQLLLVNDNDFGIDPTQKTLVTLLPLPAAAK